MLTKMAMKPKSGALANISFNTNNPVLADSRVFVGNLRTETVTQEQLHKLFKKFGPITGLSIHKGFGFVQYTNEKNARAAVDGTHGSDLGGQKIDCRIASEGASRSKPKKPLDSRSDKNFGNSQPFVSPASLTPELVRNNVLTLLHSNPMDQPLDDFENDFQQTFGYSLAYHALPQLGFSNVQEYMSFELGNVVRFWLDASNSVFMKLDGQIPLPDKNIPQPTPSTVAPAVPANQFQSPVPEISASPWSSSQLDDATKSVPTQALTASMGLGNGTNLSSNTGIGNNSSLGISSLGYPLAKISEPIDKPIMSYYEYAKIDFSTDIILKVYLAHCENPSNLVVQICGDGFSSSLDDLNDRMSMLYSDASRKHLYEVNDAFFSIGQCCVAKYENLHYRATILNVLSASKKCVVLYVDYGNEDQVDCSDILALHEDFIQLPMQAIQVSLAHLAPSGTTLRWIPDAKTEIDEYQDMVLDCKLVHVDSRQLFVQLSYQGQSLSDKLLKSGIAKYQDLNYGTSNTITHFPPCSRYQKLDFAMKSNRPDSRHMFASPSVDRPPHSLINSPANPSTHFNIGSRPSPSRSLLSAGDKSANLTPSKSPPAPAHIHGKSITSLASKLGALSTGDGQLGIGGQHSSSNGSGPLSSLNAIGSGSGSSAFPSQLSTYLIPSTCFQPNVAVISPAAPPAISNSPFPSFKNTTQSMSKISSMSNLPPPPKSLPQPQPPSDMSWEGSKITRHTIDDPVTGKWNIHVITGDYPGIYISMIERMKLTGEPPQYLLSHQHCILVHKGFESLYSEMQNLNLLYNNEIILCDLDRTYLALNACSQTVLANDLLDGLFDVILKATGPLKLTSTSLW